MAEQSQADRKSQLIAELERSRSSLARGMRGVRHDLDVGRHLKHAFFRQKTAWLTGAAVTGWILAKLPGRKKTVKIKPVALNDKKAEAAARGGLLVALLSLAGTLLRPAITSFATRKITELASAKFHGNGAPRYARR